MRNALISREGWEPALSLVVSQILERVKPDVVFLGWADGDSYRVVGAWGVYSDVFENAVLPLAMTHCKAVIDNQKPLRIADSTVHDLHTLPEHLQAHPCRSYLGVPLNVSDDPAHYTLAVAHVESHDFSDDDEALLLAMADLLSTQAERELLGQRLEQQGLRLSLLLDIGLATAGGVRGVANSVCQACACLFDVAMVRVVRVDGEPAEMLASIVPPGCEQKCDLGNPALGPEMAVKRVGQVRMQEFCPDRIPGCDCWRDDGPLGFLGLPIFDALGKVVAVLSVIDVQPRAYDESELSLLKVFAEKLSAEWTREQIEQKALSAEKYASVARLAAGVAHEFKNYLAGIMGNASLAKGAVGDRERVDKVLQRVLDICTRANQTALSLLSYVRDAEGDRQVTDLASLIGEVRCLVDQQAIKRHVDLTFDFEPYLCADIVAAQIRQVIHAILENALEAIPDGGTVTVQTRAENRHAVVRVIDTGVGIPRENLPRIFDPFFSTKGVWGGQDGNGTGLGLTSSLNFVREHGGDIIIDTREGAGTTVTIALPLASPEPGAGSVSQEMAGERRALVMEFDAALREMLTSKLEQAGWEVVTCEKAAQLAAALKGGAAVAFLDVLMPGKINFIRAFEHLRESCPNCRIFVTTSDATDYQLADYIRAAVGRIVKPASGDKVSAFLEVHLSNQKVPS